MSDKRISKVPSELLAQMAMAIQAIQADGSWGNSSPNLNALIAAHQNLNSDILTVEADNAKLLADIQTRDASVETGFTLMQQVDWTTDARFTPTGAQKAAYGVPPKKVGGPSVPLTQVVIDKVGDGNAPASIALRWQSQKGTDSYTVEWFSDPDLTQKVGNCGVTGVSCEVTGLTAKQQYWLHVRAVRGQDFGHWSDPATRVAGL